MFALYYSHFKLSNYFCSMKHMKPIIMSDYRYNLPDSRIARYPLPERDSSKLLVYRKGNIEHCVFKDISNFLSRGSLLVFNETKVIPARIIFFNTSGKPIEILMLEPADRDSDVTAEMLKTCSCEWFCMVGRKKNWKRNQQVSVEFNGIILTAEFIERDTNRIIFHWTPRDKTFAEIIEIFGRMPLPPYLNREAEDIDTERYQTTYSNVSGSVAAPTAGLHFTERTFESLKNSGIGTDYLTLHVGAGTFQPVKTDNALDHTMHEERMVIARETIQKLLEFNGKIIPVGTTSMRTLESLFWFGQLLEENPDAYFNISQQDPYFREPKHIISSEKALENILHFMERRNLNNLRGYTSIYIHPGYTFRICKGIITNFHQPESTLILLIAALIGEDWRKVYASAMENEYRFLSYGDSSLLLP